MVKVTTHLLCDPLLHRLELIQSFLSENSISDIRSETDIPKRIAWFLSGYDCDLASDLLEDLGEDPDAVVP